MLDETYKLCYVEWAWAYFTTRSLEQQWGDDWNDAPYEHNAGTPYTWAEYMGEPKYDVQKVAWDGNFETPSEGHSNSPFSVEQINAGAIAWLRTSRWEECAVNIFAGTTFPDFVKLIHKAGGHVFVACPNASEE